MLTLDEVVRRFDRPKRLADGSFMVRCPCHDDRQASLHITQGDGGNIVMKCHAGCVTDAIMAAKELAWKDVTVPKEAARRVVAVYPYRDESGNTLYETVRYAPKDFRQRVPNGDGGYTYSLKGVRRVLYNLPALAPTIAEGKHILLVEGEKDVDGLSALGFAATSSPMGAGKFLPEYAESLRGALVDLLPDNDEAGREHMQKAAALLYGVAKEVRIVDLCGILPDLPPKGDISDVLEKLGARETIVRLAGAVSATDPFVPKAVEQGEQAKRTLQATNAAALMANDFAPLVEAVQGLIVEGVTLLVGASKIGKSWLVLALCMAVSSGRPFLNRPTLQGEVLYLALEDSPRRLQNRLCALGVDADTVRSLSLCTEAPTLDGGVAELMEQWLSEHPAARLIVIDTLQKVRGIPNRSQNAYQADYEMMGRIKRLADARHVAVVLVHHTNKSRMAADSFDRVNGSTGLMGAADTTLLIERDRDEKDATVKVVGRDVYADDFMIRFDGGAWHVVAEDAQAYTAEQLYAANPVVQLLRSVAAENPDGGRFPYERLINDGIRLLGHAPFVDARDFAAQIKGVRGELSKRDGIEVETGIRINVDDGGLKRSTRGIKIATCRPVTSFQTRIDA